MKKTTPSYLNFLEAHFENPPRFSGQYEMPWLSPTSAIPKQLVPYSQRNRVSNEDCFICFFEDDKRFLKEICSQENIARELSSYSGVIGPDISVYRNMPLVTQLFAIYASKSITLQWQAAGIECIPNIRWGDERTYQAACDGVPRCSTICISSLGCLRDTQDRHFFIEGCYYAFNRLEPKVLIWYGSLPQEIQIPSSTQLIQYECWSDTIHRKA